MRHDLIDKQKAFVQEYLLDLNATQAAIRAAVNAVFGSTTDCYYAIEKAIENEINEPTPNVITFKPGEGVVFGWE